jgi:hypothetical protein
MWQVKLIEVEQKIPKKNKFKRMENKQLFNEMRQKTFPDEKTIY